MTEAKQLPAVFTPSDEPYLGRPSLHRLDLTIIGALRANQAAAAASHDLALSDLQAAACQIIPQGISIALSARELIRQGYLFSAFILLRPLIERGAIISYLVHHPEAVEMWKDGWNHGKRPSLRKMLQSMQAPGSDTSLADAICELTNHAVHGDPMAAAWNTIGLTEGSIGFASGRILDRPDFCDAIADNAFPHLIVLMAMMSACFPGVEEIVPAITDTVEQVIAPNRQLPRPDA